MTIRIGTSERDGTFHSQGLALKAVFERRAGLSPVVVLESGSASMQNAQRLDAGEIEFGFMASNWIGRARNGEPPFVRPLTLAMAAPMNAGPLFFIARADSSLHSVRDLGRRRVAVGLRTSGMVQHAHGIFAVLGLGDVEPVHLDFADGAQALAAGEVDAQFQCPIPNKVMTELASRTDLRVLPYAPGEIETVVDAIPYYRRTVMQKGVIRGLDADVAQLAVVNVLVTHPRVPAALVQAAVETVVSDSGALAELNPLFGGLAELFEPMRSQGAAALEFGGVPLHPGARAVYRALGLLA
jgi:TRAP transporter TAXI family solute receptor